MTRARRSSAGKADGPARKKPPGTTSAIERSAIERVELLDRDPGFCRILVAGAWHGPIRREDAERMGLTEGKAWSRATSAKVQGLVAEAAARRRGLQMLARGDLSAAALQERLTRRGSDAATAKRVVAALREDGWLDDHRSAFDRAAALTRRRLLSHAALESILVDEGFPEPLARDAAGAALESISDSERALSEAIRLRGEGVSFPGVASRLARGGFDSDTIAEVLARLGFEPIE